MENTSAPLRSDVVDAVQKKVDKAVTDSSARSACLQIIAHIIETADDQRNDSWLLRETTRGIAVVVGRRETCRVERNNLYVSVLGPISEEIRTSLECDARDNEAWKWVPGGLYLKLPAAKAKDALVALKTPMDQFVERAIGRLRRGLDSEELEQHLPEAVAFVANAVGRPLPSPKPAPTTDTLDGDDDDEPLASREPKVRGRAPIFENGHRRVASLMSDIEREVMALPDLQRPFVWEDTKVRDLLDSLFLGFPVGTLVLWQVNDEREAHALGATTAALRASTLIIDGQQRLTSLYAVMRNKPVVDKNGDARQITIAFRPRDGRFEVADAAIKQDPEFIKNVSEIWNGTKTTSQWRREIVNALRDKKPPVDTAYEDAVDHNLDRARAISDYRFPTVEIRKTADGEATEEDVAEIFVRINNQGTRLGQADFVLTLLSVFHGELRDRIELHARQMSSGAVITVDTQQLLRAACALGFGRARMSAIYRYLRGVDPVTGADDPASRKSRLDALDHAANDCIDATTWRDYILRVVHAGFVSPALIASPSAIMNAYAFYLCGRRAGVTKPVLDKLISRWLFGTLVTARYSASSETMFEQDLARVRDVKGDAFVAALDGALSEALTNDYWSTTLVASLHTQRSRAPAALAFRAAQVVLSARALFTDQPLQNLLNPPGDGKRSASEMHHIFPKDWLRSRAITDRKDVNQVANLADVGWYENVVIGGAAPATYVPMILKKLSLSQATWDRMCAEHALPPKWESMDYETFLHERRLRMAEIVRVAYRKLGGEPDAPAVEPPWFVAGAEIVWTRITETERSLRSVVREVYAARFGDNAAQRIENNLNEQERTTLQRALRARPPGADPLSVIDYLYLGQLPALLFKNDIQQDARARLGGAADVRARLDAAMQSILPVRNEIAHVREVEADRLQRAMVACNEVLAMLRP